ncbi:hypothetical protein [Nocardia sp. NPDC004711]
MGNDHSVVDPVAQHGDRNVRRHDMGNSEPGARQRGDNGFRAVQAVLGGIETAFGEPIVDRDTESNTMKPTLSSGFAMIQCLSRSA